MERGFGHYDERHLFEYLAANDPTCTPEACRIAVVDGAFVACTVVLPRRVRTRWGWVAGVIVTLVCTDPNHRLAGHGAATVRDSLAVAAKQGASLAILYGVPAYYPRFGFVPVLPRRYETTLDLTAPPTASATPPRELASEQPVAVSPRITLASDSPGAADLQALEDGNIAAVCELYHATLGRYPVAVERAPEQWIWRFRTDDARQLLVWPVGGGLGGYALTVPDADSSTLTVPEAAVTEPGHAPQMLRALGRYAAELGLSKLTLQLPPGEPLARAARLAGAERRQIAAISGMAAVLSWDGLLPEGYAVSPRGELLLEGRPVLRTDYPMMAQLVLGHASATDLEAAGGDRCEWLVDGPWRERVRETFGDALPRWTLAPYW